MGAVGWALFAVGALLAASGLGAADPLTGVIGLVLLVAGWAVRRLGDVPREAA